MSRNLLILAVFNATPRTYRGITRAGEHQVKLHKPNDNPPIPDYAILESLSIESLEGIARSLEIAV